MKYAIFAASALALAASASAMIIEPNQGLESRDMSPPMPVGFADKPCIKFKRARARECSFIDSQSSSETKLTSALHHTVVWISDKPGHSKKELCDRFIAGCNFGMNWEKYCEVSKVSGAYSSNSRVQNNG